VDRIDGEAAGLVGCFGKEERLERHGKLKNPSMSKARGRCGEADFRAAKKRAPGEARFEKQF
jgi:hypothetical protein